MREQEFELWMVDTCLQTNWQAASNAFADTALPSTITDHLLILPSLIAGWATVGLKCRSFQWLTRIDPFSLTAIIFVGHVTAFMTGVGLASWTCLQASPGLPPGKPRPSMSGRTLKQNKVPMANGSTECE